ncbi:SAMP-activating enzyme E1 [Metallosphaera sp. J1]|uniref:HesA/MoeB/ThiF family protein n=1 Tax=Metallosphaera javensis (ex Hofmann et al. 2022) TaxID=99938 RepID=UPI001EE122BF|nr:HesA/MoeB/ThiF family protein [Metallosphaera javensis (ex Hofmann et al. 2022)]MCG3109730.1 SAMP-activating enzyme E1 [Metallosphaera javensis (ex Hofmann et al. 2022)]
MDSLSNLEMFTRQLLVLGPEIQEKLFSLNVLVAGCGALGTAIIELLVRLGVGHVTVVDADVVETSNLHRTHLFTLSDVGKPKALVCAQKAMEIGSGSRVTPVLDIVDETNAESLVKGMDFVFDALDNVNPRLILNDACVKNGVPLIYGGVSGEYGSALFVSPRDTPCLSCFMEPMDQADACETMGTTVMTVSLVANLQVQMMLNALRGDIPRGLYYVDARSLTLQVVDMKRNPSCEACSLGEYKYLGGIRTSCGLIRVNERPPEGPRPYLRRMPDGLLICYENCFKKIGR